jgi:hypothetical protein
MTHQQPKVRATVKTDPIHFLTLDWGFSPPAPDSG